MYLVGEQKIGKNDLDPTNKRVAFFQRDIINLCENRKAQTAVQFFLCEFLHLLCEDLHAHS